MGIGRQLSSEKIAQAVALANFNYCQIQIRRVLGCSKGALQKNEKKMYRQTGNFKDKPGRGDPVSQLLTETQLSQSDLKTRGSRLFTSLQIIQIWSLWSYGLWLLWWKNSAATLQQLYESSEWGSPRSRMKYPRIPCPATIWRNFLQYSNNLKTIFQRNSDYS